MRKKAAGRFSTCDSPVYAAALRNRLSLNQPILFGKVFNGIYRKLCHFGNGLIVKMLFQHAKSHLKFAISLAIGIASSFLPFKFHSQCHIFSPRFVMTFYLLDFLIDMSHKRTLCRFAVHIGQKCGDIRIDSGGMPLSALPMF